MCTVQGSGPSPFFYLLMCCYNQYFTIALQGAVAIAVLKKFIKDATGASDDLTDLVNGPDDPSDPSQTPSSQQDPQTPLSQQGPQIPFSQQGPQNPFFQQGPQSSFFQQAPQTSFFQQAPQTPFFQQAPQTPFFQQAPQTPFFQQAPQSPFFQRRDHRAVESALEKLDEVQKMMLTAATHLDTDGCVLKLLCYLHNKQRDSRSLEENLLLQLFFSSSEKLSRSARGVGDQITCDQVFPKCPLGKEELSSLMVQTSGCGSLTF
nr:IgA FC receptor-like isoform X1 [Cherax quadricarinatus]